MKISEMTNNQAAEALIRLSVPFGNICDDEKMVEIITKYTESRNEPFIRAIGRILPDAVSYALKEHRNDLFEIVGALTGKTVEQVSKMKLVDTLQIVKESYDEVLHGFFTSSVRQIKESVEKQ